MNVIKIEILSLLSFVLISCVGSSEKNQYTRDNIVYVRDNIEAVQLNSESALLNGFFFIPVGDYLLALKWDSPQGMVDIVDRDTYEPVWKGVRKGRARGELVNPGVIFADENNRRFFFADYGRCKLFEYDVDSLINDPNYLPKTKITFQPRSLPLESYYISDTLCYTTVMNVDKTGQFSHIPSRWNLNTGETKALTEASSDDITKRITIAVSERHNLLVEAYQYVDLIRVSTLDGELKYNIYGPMWGRSTSNDYMEYESVVIYDDYIIAGYSGCSREDVGWFDPDKFIVFDLDGDYVKTLDVGCKILCYYIDERSGRLVMVMDDPDIPFGYLSLDQVL